MSSNAKPQDARNSDEYAAVSSNDSLSAALGALIASKPVDKAAVRRLEKECSAPYALVLVQNRTDRAKANALDAEDFFKTAAPASVSTLYEDSTVIFMSYSTASVVGQGPADKSKLASRSIAISMPFHSASDIPQQYELLKYSLANGSGHGVKNAKDHALGFLLDEIAERVDFKGLLHPALDVLARYDASNQSSLLETLGAYLENDRNAQRCANALYLHRNSLQYRVRRIQEIAKIDLDDPAERAYLRLSFLLRSK